MVGSIAQEYLTDREGHDKTAREWTQRLVVSLYSQLASHSFSFSFIDTLAKNILYIIYSYHHISKKNKIIKKSRVLKSRSKKK